MTMFYILYAHMCASCWWPTVADLTRAPMLQFAHAHHPAAAE